MLIREFLPQDARTCCEVINACVPSIQGLNAAARFHIIAKNVPDDLYQDLQQWYTLVVELHGQIVAVGALDHKEIRRLYVSPDVQGYGIGSALMNALETEARSRNYEQVSLEASPNSERFYLQLGYQSVGQDRREVGAAVFEYVKMTKILSQGASV